MFYRLKLCLFALLVSFLVACTDNNEGVEYLFDREVSEITVHRECAKGADSGAYCFSVQFRLPIEKENLETFYLWVGNSVIGDTAKGVSKSKLEKATLEISYPESDLKEFSRDDNFGTIDLTTHVEDFVKDRTDLNKKDSLMIGIFCGYSDDKNSGSIQRVYLHFGDDIPPSVIPNLSDSTWTTGALFDWYRPSDQRDYYKPSDVFGPITGYNVVIYSKDVDEDLRKVKVKVITADGTDSLGQEFFRFYEKFKSDNNDSIWLDSVNHGENRKNYLFLAILDGKGVDSVENENNHFRMIIEGLKPEREYTIGLTAFDSAGNYSGPSDVSPVDSNQLFITTDSIAPLMATKIFTLKDSLYPEMARLDSNNRLRIFWSRSVDPIVSNHDIKEDSILIIPENCSNIWCYDTVASYVIDYYDQKSESWVNLSNAGGSGRYSELYKVDGDTMEVDPQGTFVTDTIRWVVPGDTLILRIRSKDKSRYYSRALVDTVVVSPGKIASKIDCPEGFVPVSAGDTNIFCMERYEHRDELGKFVSNILHSEAMAACEAISASGFDVKLCGEKDWQQVCLSGGTLSYGVIVENTSSTSDYLFSDCNVATNSPKMAFDIALRSPRCVSPMGIHDFPGELQEWVMGRSEDTLAVVKGGSYETYSGVDRESIALCTTRSFPYYSRLAYVTDTVYLYREGTKIDTVYKADSSRSNNLYEIITANHSNPDYRFKDSLQFFDVQDSSGNSIGTDYALYSEYKKGGEEWLKKLAGDLKYVPDHVEVVFLTGGRVAYRQAASFYKSTSIGFRCCAYPQ